MWVPEQTTYRTQPPGRARNNRVLMDWIGSAPAVLMVSAGTQYLSPQKMGTCDEDTDPVLDSLFRSPRGPCSGPPVPTCCLKPYLHTLSGGSSPQSSLDVTGKFQRRWTVLKHTSQYEFQAE